jgi:hypothetical protein
MDPDTKRVRNFLQNPDPELEVMDPGPQVDLNPQKIVKQFAI